MKDFYLTSLYQLKKIHNANKKKLAILMYHGIVDGADKYNLNFWSQIHKDIFESHMKYVSDNCNPISLSELYRSPIEHEKIPDYPVCITFDDGYENNFLNAVPILEKFKIPASFFCSSNFIGTDNLLWIDRVNVFQDNIDQISNDILKELETTINELVKGYGKVNLKSLSRTLKAIPLGLKKEVLDCLDKYNLLPTRASGYSSLCAMSHSQLREISESVLFDIGAHTQTHEILTLCPYPEANKQISGSFNEISKILKKKITMFAYPNGNYNQDLQKMVKDAGGQLAVSTHPGLVAHDADILALPRISVGSDISSDLRFFGASIAGIIPEGSYNPLKIVKGHIKQLSPDKYGRINSAFYTFKKKNKKASTKKLRLNGALTGYIRQNKIRSVHFVCQGNICRSAFTAAFLEKLESDESNESDLAISSSGLWAKEGRRVECQSLEAGKSSHVALEHHRARQTTSSLLEEADLVFCFERWHFASCIALSPLSAGKVFLIGQLQGAGSVEVPDPYGEPLEVFLSCFQKIEELLQTFHRILKKKE